MRTHRAPVLLNRFDLLPPSFHCHERVRQVTCSWLTIVCMLSATLFAVTIATMLRKHRAHRASVRLASTAIPLMDLRRDVIRLQEENNRRDQWCQRVETARPDDGVLQTLGAVAVASQSDSHGPVIDSLFLRLPVEFPADAKETPAWAIPHVSISARIATTGEVDQWVDQLRGLDRIESPAIVEDSDGSTSDLFETDGEIRRVQLTATPLATRVLP